MARERGRPRAPPFGDPPGYVRHRPEWTVLYQLVERHYPDFLALREAAGRPLPRYVQDEFEVYLKCGRLEYGFLRVRCEDCHAEKLVAFSCKRRGSYDDCPLPPSDMHAYAKVAAAAALLAPAIPTAAHHKRNASMGATRDALRAGG